MAKTDLNTVIISGNVVKDVFTSPTGKVVKFSVMVHDPQYGDSCIPCEAFSSLIDIASCLQKGDYVTVAGRVKQSSYERKADHQRVNIVEITAAFIAVGCDRVSVANGQLDGEAENDELFPGDNAAKKGEYNAYE